MIGKRIILDRGHHLLRKVYFSIWSQKSPNDFMFMKNIINELNKADILIILEQILHCQFQMMIPMKWLNHQMNNTLFYLRKNCICGIFQNTEKKKAFLYCILHMHRASCRHALLLHTCDVKLQKLSKTYIFIRVRQLTIRTT